MKNINKQEVNLSTNIIQEITNTAKKYPQIHKIILYGSRARKDNLPTGDIDLAV